MNLRVILLFILLPNLMIAQTLYDENKVPDFDLPALFNTPPTIEEWKNDIRPKWIQTIEKEMFGHFPDEDIEVSFAQGKLINHALDGKAVIKEVDMIFKSKNEQTRATLLIFLPGKRKNPVPVFLGLNFYGNHTIHAHPEITITPNWVRNNTDFFMENHRADDRSRGIRKSRWPIETILDRGYGVAVIYCGDLDPDYDDQFENGIHALVRGYDKSKLSTISAWAWGLSRAMDYFEQDPDIDHNQVAVVGHSRLGKTSLWAGASDTRFAMVISNDSGCGGAAISRRRFGETVKAINDRFPHWFNERFTYYNDK